MLQRSVYILGVVFQSTIIEHPKYVIGQGSISSNFRHTTDYLLVIYRVDVVPHRGHVCCELLPYRGSVHVELRCACNADEGHDGSACYVQGTTFATQTGNSVVTAVVLDRLSVLLITLTQLSTILHRRRKLFCWARMSSLTTRMYLTARSNHVVRRLLCYECSSLFK